MTIPENTGRPPAPAAFGKPSLMGGPSDAATVGETTQPLRMLDALGDDASGGRAGAPSRVRIWLLALSLTMLAVAAFSWWQQREDVTRSPAANRVGRAAPDAAPNATSTEPAPPLLSAPSAPTAIEPRPPVVATAPSTGPASIERSTETDPLLVLSRPAAASSVAGPPPIAATPVAVEKRAAASAKPTKVAAANERRRKAEAAAHGKKVVTAKAAPRPARSSRPDAPSSVRDPDVTLLSAMLARLSSDNPNDVATIAQLVERCDARRGKESSEAADCRRQVCAGHWGKTEACPLSLAPKRN